MKSIKRFSTSTAVVKQLPEMPNSELARAQQRSERFTKHLRVTKVAGEFVTNEVQLDEAVIAARVEQIQSTPANSLSWLQLNELKKAVPELAQDRWNEILESALAELSSGHRAAKATEGFNSTPYERARFIVLLAELRRQYEPRNGAEEILIQNLAQAQTLYEQALKHFCHLTTTQCNMKTEDDDEWTPPRITEAEAVEQAALTVERFHRLFCRSLRALRDLRRVPAIVANQMNVNVSGQQVVTQNNDG